MSRPEIALAERSPNATERWLATADLAPDAPLAVPNPDLPLLLLRWLAEPGGASRLEWRVDLVPGGAVRAWLHAGPRQAEDLCLLVHAAGLPAATAVAPPERGVERPCLWVHLGGPVAWMGRTPRRVEAVVHRARWLAERGLGMRLCLRMWSLAPPRPARRRVDTFDARLPAGAEEWDPRQQMAARAARIANGVPFALSLEPDRRLGTAEHVLLTEALAQSFGARVQLRDRGCPVLAEAELALGLLGAFGAVRSEDAEEREPSRTE